MLRRARSRRGQATVELAVTLVVLIPLTMYTLFLEDFNSYFLDWQEAITTSPWDFTAADYSTTVNADGAVAHNNRREFCDHTSAYTSFDANYECNSNIHHKALTAHECWLVKNTGNTGGRASRSPAPSTRAPASSSRRCTARCTTTAAWVSAPRRSACRTTSSSTASSSAALSTSDMISTSGAGGSTKGLFHETGAVNGKSVHSNSNMGWGWIIGAQGTPAETHFGLIVDPWAIATNDDHDPDTFGLSSGDDFKKRVDLYFDLFGGIAGLKALKFGYDLASDDLIGYQAMVDSPVGDTPLTDTLAWKKDYKREVNGHYASGYNDRQESDYGTRKDGYLSKDNNAW